MAKLSKKQKEKSETQEATGQTPKITAEQIKPYLVGIEYPAVKTEIIGIAEANSVPDNIKEVLNKLPDVDYEDFSDVEDEITKVQQ